MEFSESELELIGEALARVVAESVCSEPAELLERVRAEQARRAEAGRLEALYS